MKVLILNDCGEEKTGVFDLLKGICDGIAAPHEIEWVNIHSLTIQPCEKCHKCFPYGECLLPEDDAHRIGRMLFTADALVVGLNTKLNAMSTRFRILVERCMASIALQDRQGKICPWRKGRVAVVAGLEVSELLGCDSQNKSDVFSDSLTQVLKSGGFHVIGSVTEDAGAGSWPGMLPKEQARALGCSLSCMVSV